MSAMNFREPNQVKWVGVRPAHNGEQLAINNNAQGTTITMYTVPTDQVAFVDLMVVTLDCNAANHISGVYVEDSGGTIIYRIIGTYVRDISTRVYPISFYPPLELPSGYQIIISSDSSDLITRVFIHGWVE